MAYNLNGELYVESKEAAKMLFEKLASVVDTALSDKRDNIYMGRRAENVVISFDLRFDTKEERDEIREWLVERHENAIKGVLREHTCNDENEENCTDYAEVLKWGDWVDD